MQCHRSAALSQATAPRLAASKEAGNLKVQLRCRGNALNDENELPGQETGQASVISRRTFFGTAALAGVGVATLHAAGAQTRKEAEQGRQGDNASDPGQENKVLLDENPDSNTPPATDHGDVGAIWYSFDLAKKRLQGGGWTHQVTQRELPNSKEIAGVNMRLTAGSFRELHWHTADEWALMLTGKARVTVMQPDGKMFVDDIEAGDLWYFPAGFPHSIQGLNPNGCEFLLVFDQGDFSEDDTFLLSDWIAHTPPEVLAKNMSLSLAEVAQLPKAEMYIFKSAVPGSLEDAKRAVGDNLETENKYTFHVAGMAPTKKTASGEVRIFDTTNFPISKNIAAAVVRVKPGGMRELHWHSTGTEWQFYLQGSARMTVFGSAGRARTMDFNANDVGYVPSMAGHYIENTGKEDLVFLETFKTAVYQDLSLNNWIRRLPPETATAHLGISQATLEKIPSEKTVVVPK